MARTYKTINLRINLSKLNKEHYTFVKNKEGRTEIQADFRLLFTEDEIEVETKNGKKFTHNGYVSQQVSKETYEAEKNLPDKEKTQMPILGNCKHWAKRGADESSLPGGVGSPVTDEEGAKVTSSLPF